MPHNIFIMLLSIDVKGGEALLQARQGRKKKASATEVRFLTGGGGKTAVGSAAGMLPRSGAAI